MKKVMNKQDKNRKIIGGIIVFVIVAVGIAFLLFALKAKDRNNTDSSSEYGFIGKGTKDSPYLISSVEDLEHFRDLVNGGEPFDYKHFKQTEDLDLALIDNWIPIGIFGSDNYFYGYYDGDGHTLSNLNCVRPKDYSIELDYNVGLFGILCGEVRNLGIESGLIDGSYVGAIASHGNANAVIINCYNKATVNGNRAGGIADNFRGPILFCINLGKITGPESAGIVSYSAQEIYCCYSTTDNLVTAHYTGKTNHSMTISKQDMDADFIKNYYKTIQEWNSSYIDKDNLSRVAINDGDIQYADDTFFGILEQFSAMEILIGIMVVVMFILIRYDYIINVKVQNKVINE